MTELLVWKIGINPSNAQYENIKNKIQDLQLKTKSVILSSNVTVEKISLKEKKMTGPTNWTIISQRMNDELKEFVSGKLSGREFYRKAQLNGIGGEVRGLLRNRGVEEARRLGKKALSRRS